MKVSNNRSISMILFVTYGSIYLSSYWPNFYINKFSIGALKRIPHPLSIYVQKFSTPLTLDVQF